MDKTIKVSTRAYEVMVRRKEKYGLGIKQQVDDLIFKCGSGVSLMEVMAAFDAATKDKLEKLRCDNSKDSLV